MTPGTDAAPVPDERASLPAGGVPAVRGEVAFWVSAAALALLVLLVYGFTPGSSEVTLMATTTTGTIACLHDQGLASLWTWCMQTGLPVGSPTLTGLPQVYLGWLLSYLPGVSPWAANQLVGCVVALLGGGGAFLLLRRWSVPRWLALLVTGSYLLGPNLLQLNGFAFTFDGFILLPAYVYVALRVLDRMRAGRWATGVCAAAATGLVMAFTDGYSFFGASVLIGCVVLGWAALAWRDGRRWSAAAGLSTWVASLAGSALLYAAWAPPGSYTGEPYLETFGQLGVDLATLFVPTGQFLWPSLLGLPDRGLLVWGTDITPATNYLGYVLMAAAVAGVVVALRRRSRTDVEVLAVGLAAVLTLLLSLGPTLKIAQIETGLDASVAGLPTAWLYENVPGFSSLRATNRWLVATRLCVLLLAAVALSAAWQGRGARSGRRTAAVIALVAVAVAEVLPVPARIATERRLSVEQVRYLDDGIVAEAERMLEDDELVLMLPSTNDFLANYLVPLVGVRSYNVGIDKNHALSSAAWPESVRAANAGYGPGSADLLCTVLRQDADVVVLPYPDTRSAPLLQSEDPVLEAQRERWARHLATDPRFTAESGEWLTTLRPAAGGPCAPGGARP